MSDEEDVREQREDTVVQYYDLQQQLEMTSMRGWTVILPYVIPRFRQVRASRLVVTVLTMPDNKGQYLATHVSQSVQLVH